MIKPRSARVIYPLTIKAFTAKQAKLQTPEDEMNLSPEQLRKLAQVCKNLEDLSAESQTRKAQETSFTHTAERLPTPLRVLLGITTLGGSEIAFKISRS